MNNCLIFGFGRSGTSMLGGLFAECGYFTGENSYPPRQSNPKGFYEDARINSINERILAKYDDKSGTHPEPGDGKLYSPYHPRYGQRWLSYIKPGTILTCADGEISTDIKVVLDIRQPFALKDPRFSYTLNVWQEFLPENTRFICIFREPSRVVNSVITECAGASYLKDFFIDKSLAYTLWLNCYLHILSKVYPENKDRILFISYDHFIRSSQSKELESFMETPFPLRFVDPELNRAEPAEEIPVEIRVLYGELLDLSGLKHEKW